jgi:hypothetical protein
MAFFDSIGQYRKWLALSVASFATMSGLFIRRYRRGSAYL